MDEIAEIKPCPFCGSLGVAVVGPFVRCGSCGAVGPYGHTNGDAVQRWNERARTVPADQRREADDGSGAESERGAR